MPRPISLAGSVLLALALAPIAALGADGGNGAPRPDVNRTDYAALGLAGHPELQNGGVLDVTYGRERGAFELHRVSGAAPSTNYAVVGEIFFATACSLDDPQGPLAVPEGTLTTDEHGNGSFRIDFPGSAFDTAPDSFWVRWRLDAEGVEAYRSGCVQVEL